MDMYTQLYSKLIINKVLLCSTGNSAQCYVAAWMGGEFRGEWMLLSSFSRVRLCATPETAAQQAPPPWDPPGKNTGVGCHFLGENG